MPMSSASATDRAPEAPKNHRAGTHRLVSPEETLESVRRFLPGYGDYPRGRYHRAGRHRPPGGHRVPAEFKGGHGVAGQGTHPGGRQGVRCHGEHRGLHGRTDHPAARPGQRQRPALQPSAGRRRPPAQDDGLGVPPGCPHLVDRGAGTAHRNPAVGSLRDGPHRVHAAQADRNGMFHRHLQRAGLRQSSARGDQPRDLRDGGTRRGHAAQRAGARGYGVAPDRPADRGRSRLRRSARPD